jgi:16S rRNA processing protein RimM
MKQAWKVSEIVGFEVFNNSGLRLGVLSEVIVTGSNDVWVVKYDNKETLVPALKNIVKEVNLKASKIIVDMPQDCEQSVGESQAEPKYNGYRIYED